MNTKTRILPALLLAPLLAACTGCNIVALPWLMWGAEPTRDIPAEYPYLAGKRVCIAVWVDRNTAYEYPYVQLELSEFIADAIKSHVQGVTFVRNRDVVELQQAEPDWDRQHPSVIGARFRADRVLLVEVSQYSTREPDSPHLYRGRIAAGIRIYDATRTDATYLHSTSVETVYPADSVGQWGSTDTEIRRSTMEQFAADVAMKFYDHKVKVK